MDHLLKNNCNKAKCKTCVFGDEPISLSPSRINEIHGYLAKFESSHICHTTNKTCYGALEYQAMILHRLGILPEPTAECLLTQAATILNLGA